MTGLCRMLAVSYSRFILVCICAFYLCTSSYCCSEAFTCLRVAAATAEALKCVLLMQTCL